MLSIRHIALFVSDLRAAEDFYRNVFDMQVIMREAERDDGQWYTLRADKGWEDATAAGIGLDMVALKRGDFVLALFRGHPTGGAVLEIGLRLASEEIAAILDGLPSGVKRLEDDDLKFTDPFGFTWSLSRIGDVFRSNGDWAGRWLEV
jgi:catechol 2,3-dioxygenase-like lactoylglutathione lyase family enzyme